MQPCYIITYAVQGVCAVNVNGVDSVEDKPFDINPGCQINFTNGSKLQLVEACEAYHAKAPLCQPSLPLDFPASAPVYG